MKVRACLFGIAVLLAGVGFALVGAPAIPPTQAAGPLAGFKVCIDPGHGGSDPGAVNATLELYESAINLDTSYALKRLLEGAGATVAMTREDDSARTNAQRNDFCNAQNATVIISIHTNSISDPNPNGTLVLYSDESDRELAQAIYDVLYPALERGASGEEFLPYGVRRYRASILRRTYVAGALVEPAFLSNPAEAERLVQPIYADLERGVISAGCADLACRRGQIALAVYRGVVNYLRVAPTPTPTLTPTATPTPTPAPTLRPTWKPTRRPGRF